MSMEIRIREQCEACEGSGIFADPNVHPDWRSRAFNPCPSCKGTRYIESWVEIPYTLEEFREELRAMRSARRRR